MTGTPTSLARLILSDKQLTSVAGSCQECGASDVLVVSKKLPKRTVLCYTCEDDLEVRQ